MSLAIPFFTASDFGASTPWLVRPVTESDCKVTDYGTHVQRILTGIDGKVKKHVVTLEEEKGEIPFVEGGHVAAILKNPCCCEIYRRNARDKLRAEIDVHAASEMVKLATEIEKSTFDVVQHGLACWCQEVTWQK